MTSSARTEKRPAADVGRQAAPADRVTVALIPKAAQELQQLHDRTHLSKTDIVNRAITLYEFIDAQLKAGNEFVIRNPATGDTFQVVLL